MSKIKIPQNIKIVTVSGLHSNIGKTLLSQHLLGLLKNAAAVKMTTSDAESFITDSNEIIMVEGKDTWRLKMSGASKVVWITSPEDKTLELFKESLSLVSSYKRLLIEGNSILKYLDPDLSFFLCDRRILAYDKIKPSRKLALGKTNVIINNLRGESSNEQEHAQIAEFCDGFNSTAEFINLDLSKTDTAIRTLKKILNRYDL